MSIQSKVNNSQLHIIPDDLLELNPLETRLISLRIPFMTMVALPTGRQRCIHGPAVNVPTDLSSVCSLLPRLPSQSQILPMKLKRKLSYSCHYIYDFVRPDKVLVALATAILLYIATMHARTGYGLYEVLFCYGVELLHVLFKVHPFTVCLHHEPLPYHTITQSTTIHAV